MIRLHGKPQAGANGRGRRFPACGRPPVGSQREIRKIFIFRLPGGLTGEKAVYGGSREAAPRGRLFALLQRQAMAGAEKSPGGNGRETCVRRLARAIRRANRAGARRARAGAGAHAGYARKKGPAAPGGPRGGENGMNGNPEEGRPCQTGFKGRPHARRESSPCAMRMPNRTKHDTS